MELAARSELSFLVGVDAVEDTQRSRGDLDEALGVVGGPSVLHLAILAELALEQVIG